MENRLNDKKAVQFFMILLVLLCGLVYAGWYLLKQDGLIAALMWAPGLAGIITQRRYYKGQNVLGFRWGDCVCLDAGLFAAGAIPRIVLRRVLAAETR